MLIIFQVIFVLFVLFAIWNVFVRRRDGALGPKATLFWMLFWFAVGLIIIWPNVVQKLADHIGIGRGVDMVIYIAIASVFFLIFKMNVKIEGLKRDLTEVVRKEALSHKLKSNGALKHGEIEK